MGKYLGLAFVIILVAIFLMGFMSAEELTTFDNAKNYDALNQKVTIVNTFNIGRTIADVKLETPLINYVPVGYQKVAEFTINSYDDTYTNALEKMEFQNINENYKVIDKQFDYKVLTNKSYEVNDYSKERICNKNIDDKNLTEICDYEIIGTHLNYYEEWEDIEDLSLLKGKYVIGIFTEVYMGDKIEFIPTYFGVKMIEFASYVQSSGTKIYQDIGGVNYTTLTYTSNGYFNYTGTDNLNVSILIIAGGGGGGGGNYNGAGGGAGGLIWDNDLNVSAGNYNIIIGTGGSGGTAGNSGNNGINTSAFSLVAFGGGGAGGSSQASNTGGSGGGGSYDFITGGLGKAGQGNNGGDYVYAEDIGGGGGGAGGVGQGGVGSTGNGGIGLSYSIYNGTSLCYAGGGGGADQLTERLGTAVCGGGAGSQGTGINGIDGTGGGGGGAERQGTATGGTGGSGIVIIRYKTSDGEEIFIPTITLNSPEDYYNSTNPAITFNITATDNQQITNVTLYIDGVLNETDTSQVNGSYQWIKTLSEGNHNWSILAYNNNSLSTQSATRYFTINTTPSVVLTAPVNYANLSYSNVYFNATINSVYDIANVTFYLNGTANETITTGVNGSYNILKNMGEGYYNWSIKSCSSLGGCNQSDTRFLSIDTIYPVLSTTGITDLYNSTSPIRLTWSLFNADVHVGSCWYYTTDDATNRSVTCNSSTITNFTTIGSKTIYYFGNDTFGNLVTGSSTLFIGYYPYNHNSDKTSVGEGTSVVFTLYVNGTNINSQFGDTNATLNLNGTDYIPDTIDRTNANYVKFTKTIIVTGGNSTGMNYPFNWTYNIQNSTTIVLTQLTDTKNLSVYSMTITDGSLSCGSAILNMTIKNEETNVAIVPASNSTNIQLDLIITSKSNTSLTWNFSKTWIDNVSAWVCVPSALLTASSYKIDFTIGYKAEDYVQEFYYMDNGTLDNSGYFNSYTSNNISLMDLDLTDSTTFLFSFKDEDNLEVDDAIIHVYRDYIGDGVFREVERAKQDNNGETHVHLVGEDVIYYFMITQYGHIIYTSSNYNAKCLATPCSISLTASSDFTEFPTNYDEINGTTLTFSSNKTTRIVTLTYATSPAKTINLSLFKVVNGVVTYINTTSSTGSIGTLTLNIPSSSGNETFFASVFADNTFIRSEWIDLRKTAQENFGTSGAILGGLMVLTLIFMAISEGVVLIIIGMVAVIIIFVMGLVELTPLVIISIICAGALIIYKLTQGGNRR